jgi:hypothetical protein
MKAYEASVEIAARPDAIWRVLTDASEWSQWDSGVRRVEGRIAPGETITIHSEAAPGRDGSTLFRMREEYTGRLLSMMWRSMPDLQPSFNTFVNGLKAEAERGA